MHTVQPDVTNVQRVLLCIACRQHASDQDSSSSSVIQHPAQITCQGAKLVLPSPPVRQRSKQLQEHLAKLQDKVRLVAKTPCQGTGFVKHASRHLLPVVSGD
jgi:hypothetical protein